MSVTHIYAPKTQSDFNSQSAYSRLPLGAFRALCAESNIQLNKLLNGYHMYYMDPTHKA